MNNTPEVNLTQYIILENFSWNKYQLVAIALKSKLNNALSENEKNNNVTVPTNLAENYCLNSRIAPDFTWNSLEDMKNFYEVWNILKLPENEDFKLENIQCSCRSYVKEKRCIHVTCFIKKEKKFDILCSDIFLKTPKKGRKKKIQKNSALSKE